MSRIVTPAVASATGAAAEIFAGMRKAVGRVPNTYAAVGMLAPEALKAMLRADRVLSAGGLGKQDQETIKLAASAAAGCDYCEAAHSVLAKSRGIPAAVAAIRRGTSTGDLRRDALVRFVKGLVRSSGTVSEDDFAAIKAAGYSDADLVDISLAIAVLTFTNVFNRINDTELDFPAVH